MAVKKALRDAVVGHFSTEWKRTLSPNQHTVMAYRTTSPDHGLRITIVYETKPVISGGGPTPVSRSA
jgi:hypothetical protein